MIKTDNLSSRAVLVARYFNDQLELKTHWNHGPIWEKTIKQEGLRDFDVLGFHDESALILVNYSDDRSGLIPIRMQIKSQMIGVFPYVHLVSEMDFHLVRLLLKVVLNDDIRYVSKQPERFALIIQKMMNDRLNGRWRSYHRDTYPQYRYEIEEDYGNHLNVKVGGGNLHRLDVRAQIHGDEIEKKE